MTLTPITLTHHFFLNNPPKVEGPPVGTMQAVREIQSECLAGDLPVGEHMKEWSEERLRDYFENGGGELM